MNRYPLQLTLGPLLYYWPKAQIEQFYREALTWPLNRIYLGETVCSRRHELRLEDWLALAEELSAAGREVVLSTLTLIESESDLKKMQRVVEQGRFLVEANDFGAVRQLSRAQIPFVAGAPLNLYNPDSLALVAAWGAVRWLPPLEMGQSQLAAMQLPEGIETELWGYGRLPLAYSSRCFTARHYQLQKDSCAFRCLDHPEGMTLRSREGEPVLTLNGTQTQSYALHSLLHRLEEVKGLGTITALRLSPQPQSMGAITDLFRAALDGNLTPAEAVTQLDTLQPLPHCDGYWQGIAGLTPAKGGT